MSHTPLSIGLLALLRCTEPEFAGRPSIPEVRGLEALERRGLVVQTGGLPWRITAEGRALLLLADAAA